MFGVVKIGDREIEMAANAATAIRYGQVFHGEDLLVYFGRGFKSSTESIYVAEKLGYIMAMSAAKADMNKLSEEGFYAWLETFDQFDMVDASADIVKFYMGNEQTLSTPKKKAGQQSEG